MVQMLNICDLHHKIALTHSANIEICDPYHKNHFSLYLSPLIYAMLTSSLRKYKNGDLL